MYCSCFAQRVRSSEDLFVPPVAPEARNRDDLAGDTLYVPPFITCVEQRQKLYGAVVRRCDVDVKRFGIVFAGAR